MVFSKLRINSRRNWFFSKLIFSLLLILLPMMAWGESSIIRQGAAYFPDSSKPDNEVTTLDGEWEFYFNRLLSTIYIDEDGDSYIDRIMPDAMVKVPDFWKNYIYKQTGKNTSFGCGTYRLMITHIKPNSPYAIFIRESPGTACKVFVNGLEVASAGSVSSIPSETVPCAKPLYVEFNSNEFGNIELIVQVSNGVHRKGGLWSSVFFASREKLFSYYNTQTGVSWLVAGTLLILGILNTILFFLAPKRKEYLYFSIFVFALTFRVSIASFSIFTLIFPNIPYGFQLKLEYLAIWISPVSFLMLIYQLFPIVKANKIIKKYLYILEFSLGALVTVLPIRLANQLVPVLEIVALLCVVEAISFLIRVFCHHQPSVLLTFASVIIISCGLVGDVLFSSRKDVMPVSIMPILLLIFSVLQFLMLALQQSNMFRKQLQLVDDMKKLNDAYLRFVPREFLELLEKNSMTDVLPGDHVEREMAIIFSQIHFSNKDGTDILPEEQYALFNSYLMIISPVITKYKGFISKFISHGFMALFPYDAMDSVACALEITEALRLSKFFTSGTNDGKAIQLGIGIHTGKMILGTIGETNRLDDTVISDTVNTASRIESVAERHGEYIVLSQQTYDSVKNELSKGIELKPLGFISVKGKSKPVSLFSCRYNASYKHESIETVKNNSTAITENKTLGADYE